MFFPTEISAKELRKKSSQGTLTESEIKVFLDKKGDINSQGKFGKTALHKAIKNDHLDLALTLIKNGAKINIPEYSVKGDGLWPIDYAESKNLYKLFNASFITYNGGDVEESDDQSILKQQFARLMAWSNASVTSKGAVLSPEVATAIQQFLNDKIVQAGGKVKTSMLNQEPLVSSKSQAMP